MSRGPASGGPDKSWDERSPDPSEERRGSGPRTPRSPPPPWAGLAAMRALERVLCRCRSLLLFQLLAALSSARKVHLAPGPLYRVEGMALTLLCQVSDYEGPSLQQFEWFLYRPSAPDISIGIVSTREPNFPYAIFGPRVQASNISVRRVQGDSVELHMRAIQMEDAGVYECYTPTTDSRYRGSYSAKVEIRVIPDKLSVSAVPPSGTKPPLQNRRATAASPPQMVLLESQDLLLTCSVATATQQHTHLSVSFGLAVPSSPQILQEVIGLQRDFTVEATSYFALRQAARELSLTKLGDRQYQMVMGWLKPEDSGTYHCTAGEWIQDPDGSWQQIAQKQVALAHVVIQTIASHLSVSAGPPKVFLGSEEALELFCNISGAQALLLPHTVFMVGWYMRKAEAEEGCLVAQLEEGGGLILGKSYANLDVGTRHVSLQKLASPLGTYLLRMESAQPEDAGLYHCVVQALVRSPSTELRRVSTISSDFIHVEMKSEAVMLKASTWLSSSTLYRGSLADIRCNVSVESAQNVHLALSWWVELLQQDSAPLGAILATVDREGVVKLQDRPSGYAMSVDKVGPWSHRLRLHEVQLSDEGNYQCAVTAWVRSPDLSWYQAGSVKSNMVTVYPYPRPFDTLVIPLAVGISSALFLGTSILVSVTCCFMSRLRKR